MLKQIEIRYKKDNPIAADYEYFLIHNVDGNGSFSLLKKEPWGYSPVIKPNGTFEDEDLARMVLAYIETKRGFVKDVERVYLIAE